MTTKEIILSILKKVKPTKDLGSLNDIVEGGYIDSFELMLLITDLSEEFGIEIDVEDITPNNFNSVECITNMVDRLKSKAGT